MSNKKSTYKAKYKGVKYIARALTKYQGKKYPNYKKALPDAKKYLAELKSNKDKVTLKNLWKYSRKSKTTVSKTVGKGKQPIIDKNLLDSSFYFELVDYSTWILRCSNTLFFTSNLIPSKLPAIQGGTVIEYDDYFAPYVNFINGMKALTNADDNRYETDWLVTCTNPAWNNATKRWESKIISVDNSGNEFDYGFDRNIPTKLATKPNLSGSTKQKDTPTPPTTTPTPPTPTPPTPASANVERVKEIRGLIADLRQDVKDGFISKEDYSKMVKELTAKLENGGSI